MRKAIIAATLGLLVCIAVFFYLQSKQMASEVGNPAATNFSAAKDSTSPSTRPPKAGSKEAAVMAAESARTSPPAATAAGTPQDISARAGESIPPTNAPVNLPPETVLQNVRRVVHQYDQMFGGDPVGTNPEITAALTGQNPKKINFLAGQDGMRVNDKGELVDVWGTPYFFHQLSGTDMEIHSAGPDKIMWTSDDLVTR